MFVVQTENVGPFVCTHDRQNGKKCTMGPKYNLQNTK